MIWLRPQVFKAGHCRKWSTRSSGHRQKWRQSGRLDGSERDPEVYRDGAPRHDPTGQVSQQHSGAALSWFANKPLPGNRSPFHKADHRPPLVICVQITAGQWMMGFKAFHSAAATIAGIEVAHMIRKDQFAANGTTPFQQFAALAA